MRSFLIVASLASLASGVLFEAAAAATTEMTPGELKAYCDKKDGHYMDNGGGMTSCQIGFGKSKVVIGCSSSGKCTIDHTMVFSSKPATHGPVGQASDTTLGNGGKKPVAGNTSGASSTALKTPAGKDNKATNTRNDGSVLNGHSYVQSGRPGLQRQ